MSMVPWIRHLRNMNRHRDPLMRVIEDPFLSLTRDPFFRDPLRYVKEITADLEKNYHGIDGVLSDSEVKIDGKKVELHLDVQNFKPEQIHVKTVGNEIFVEGKNEVKKEDGWTRSHFERRFCLPDGFPPERVECHLDKGKLKLIAFRAEPLEERKIPIQEKEQEKEKELLG